MDPAEALNHFERLVNILKMGGGWAVAVLFLLLFIRSDRRYAKVVGDLKDIAVAKVESDVRTERTLEAGNAAMQGVRSELDTLGGKVVELGNVLGKILLLKTKRLTDGHKPNGDDEE